MRKLCNHCKTKVPSIFNYCTTCGCSFDAKYCSNPSHSNPPHALYCNVCGSEKLSTPHGPSKRTLTKVVLSSVSLVVVVALAFFLLQKLQALLLLLIILAFILTLTLIFVRPHTHRGPAKRGSGTRGIPASAYRE